MKPAFLDVDFNSLQVDGVFLDDYPDFCDAHFSEGLDLEGNLLSDEVLEALTWYYPELVNEAALERYR